MKVTDMTADNLSLSECNELFHVHQLFRHSFERATQAIADIVNHKMTVSHVHIDFQKSENLVNQIDNHHDNTYFASMMKMTDLLDTHIILLISETDGYHLHHSMRGDGQEHDKTEIMKDMGELNNIMGSAFINSLADMLQQTIHHTVPINTFDMLGAILQSIVMQESILDKEILIADANIEEFDRHTFHVRLIFLTEKHQLMRLLKI